MTEQAYRDLTGFQRARRLSLALLLAFVLGVLLFGQSAFPPETAFHEAIEMAGILLIFAGIAGRLWSTLYIGGRKSATLVSDGPYSISRNPLYVFSSIAAAGVGAQTGSITVAVGFAALCAAAFHIVILREEKFLSANLGAEYQAYLAKVPRFFPKWSLYHEGDTGSFKPALLLATLLDGLVFLVALPISELIDAGHASAFLPILFRLP
jgi:protein-S-isoprenylcysteine O-methyltransferase Ste14